MRTISTVTAGSFALALILTGAAFAESQRPPSGGAQQEVMTFEDLDQGNDGYITWKEARDFRPLAENWDRVDTNRNNRIEAAEFAAFQAAGMGEGRLNQDGQGQPEGHRGGTQY
jgi:hypothetical protein